MKIKGVIWLESVVNKLSAKHNVATYEAEEVLNNRPKFRLMEKGNNPEENVYTAQGQTDAQRYLMVFFIYKRTKEALILSARDMVPRERKQYERK